MFAYWLTDEDAHKVLNIYVSMAEIKVISLIFLKKLFCQVRRDPLHRRVGDALMAQAYRKVRGRREEVERGRTPQAASEPGRDAR